MTDPEYTEIWERGGVLRGLVCLFVCYVGMGVFVCHCTVGILLEGF